MIRLLLVVIFTYLLFLGCKKLPQPNQFTTIQLPVHGQVRDIKQVGNSFFLTIGSLKGNGYILKTDDFNDFQVLKHSETVGYYGIGTPKNWLTFGSSDSEILLSADSATFYSYYYEPEYWINNQHHQPVRQFLSTPLGDFAVAGGELSFGVVMYLDTLQQQYIPLEWDNALNDLIYHSQKDEVIAVGNGIILVWNMEQKSWNRAYSPSYYYTSGVHLPNNNYLLATLNGEIHEVEINALETTLHRENKIGSSEAFFNCMEEAGTQIALAGSQGFVGFSSENSSHWDTYKLPTKDDLTALIHWDGQWIFGGNGQLFRVNQ